MDKKRYIVYAAFVVLLFVSTFDRSTTQKRHAAELKAQSASYQNAHAYNNAGRTLMLLGELQNGKTDQAIGSLESDLDMELWTLLQTLKDAPAMRISSNEVNLVELIGKYQRKYPSQLISDRDMTQAVAYVKSRAMPAK